MTKKIRSFDEVRGHITSGNLEIFLYPEGHKTKVLVDGKEITYVTTVTIKAVPDEVTTALIEVALFP
jgi:hypothetical protein